ncbi:phosphoribosylaminoimidazole-succinocarboxamide synthase [Halobacteroides halobius DSM 5150]|uniref:Phosphoribosylaminoimidazole-succinocarboxamide synthase n=1 Tax=Halobacteroides halobius (strain ATCC 35273 / DSM 5150 / MD-1) TaxID=748449 RepID=L0KD36_HALHC|nr:phosphoribosylaminoimidazolesuccinocarboxamide synthase [Halobacteroides halobius]AGB42460.1 phosphoribosylaminoimidazole-succinocarboxamide synthase [Halobacteroides halobius DSM 5150]
MEKEKMIYEGKAKKVYSTNDADKVIVEYKDDATAFDGEKKGQITEKGRLNAKISTILFELLEDNGIPTHLIEKINETDVLVKKLDIILVEVVMRNVAAGSLAKRLGLEEGTRLNKPVLEFYYKDDDLGDPMINRYHVYAEELATKKQLDQISKLAFKINDILVEFLADKGIDLIDFKLEFGTDNKGKIYLGDEISPDTCRFWDTKTQKKLDKDRFRRDLGEVEGAYHEIVRRLEK